MSTTIAAPGVTTGGPVGDPPKPRVLLIDDDASLLDGLKRRLRSRLDVTAASSGAAALGLADPAQPFAVVVSDMRMPGMDGATVLREFRRQAPDTVRVLLTGYVDVDNAIAAVNEGNIFRFLCKPVDFDVLNAAIDDAIAQNRLITAERALLEQTLHGSVQAMIEVLSLVNPTAFARALRLKTLVSQILDGLGQADRWELEIASMLSQLGAATLPDSTVERMFAGDALDEGEQAMIDGLPGVADRLLAEIPRLEGVRRIIREQGPAIPRASISPDGRILKVALDADALTAAGLSGEAIETTLRQRYASWGDDLLDGLANRRGGADGDLEMVELDISQLRIGMVLETDIRTSDGRLVVARGQTVSRGMIERLANFASRNVVSRTAVVSRLRGARPMPAG